MKPTIHSKQRQQCRRVCNFSRVVSLAICNQSESTEHGTGGQCRCMPTMKSADAKQQHQLSPEHPHLQNQRKSLRSVSESQSDDARSRQSRCRGPQSTVQQPPRRNALSASGSPLASRRVSFSLNQSSSASFTEEATVCGEVQTAVLTAEGGQVASWTAARLQGGVVGGQQPMFAGLFVGLGGRQCAAAVAALAADYAAAGALLADDCGAAAARRRLLLHRGGGAGSDWNNNCGDNGGGCGLSTSLKPAGSGQFVPGDLLAAARTEWLPEFLRSGRRGRIDDLAEGLGLAMEQLDKDICCSSTAEVPQPCWAVNAASSGAVGTACVVTTDGRCCLAQLGDGAAVIGSQEGSGWVARQPLASHTIENGREVTRVVGEHPAGERNDILRRNCLLGELEPLRAFGMVRFKWTRERLLSCLRDWPACRQLRPHELCRTPPYLSGRPEVAQVRLAPRDRFLVLGSAGLWDRISPEEAVACVGELLNDRTTTVGGESLAGRLVRMTAASNVECSDAGASVAACVVLLPQQWQDEEELDDQSD